MWSSPDGTSICSVISRWHDSVLLNASGRRRNEWEPMSPCNTINMTPKCHTLARHTHNYVFECATCLYIIFAGIKVMALLHLYTCMHMAVHIVDDRHPELGFCQGETYFSPAIGRKWVKTSFSPGEIVSPRHKWQKNTGETQMSKNLWQNFQISAF